MSITLGLALFCFGWQVLKARFRLFGVTTLDVVRASRFVGEIKDVDPKDVSITVIGGHSGVTIVPLLSQNEHAKGISGDQYKALLKRIQFGGDGGYYQSFHFKHGTNVVQRSYKLKLELGPLLCPWDTVSFP